VSDTVSGLLRRFRARSKQVTGSPRGNRSVVFISHDAQPHGAQIFFLRLLRWFRAHTELDFEVILGGGGPLEPDFAAIARVSSFQPAGAGSLPEDDPLIRRLRDANVGLIYANTITNGRLMGALATLGCPAITHVHELGFWIRNRVRPDELRIVLDGSARFIAVSDAVRQVLVDSVGVPPAKIAVVHECVPVHGEPSPQPVELERVRAQLGIPRGAAVVMGCGTLDWRKAPDLFVMMARRVRERAMGRPVHFVWVGGRRDGGDRTALLHDIEKAGLADAVHFVAHCEDPRVYFAMSDVFASTSREDPFPLVVLEAATAGVPTVCFDASGGAKEFVEADAGFVVPYLDVAAMADRVSDILASPELRLSLGGRARSKVAERHDLDHVAPVLLREIEGQLGGAVEPSRRWASPTAVDARPPAVSVCIPTFNGARSIASTLHSVLGQTLADIEVVVVDDASSDDTAEIARASGDPRVSVKVNAGRLGIAGNWNRCLGLARAPLVCIFHQDDLMMPENLAQKAAFLEAHPRAGMVFSNVWQIGPRDEVLSPHWYFPPDPADQGLHPGQDFFRRLLLGPNIVCCPSVVCRREVFDVVGGFDTSMQFTLDWEMWLRIASRYPVGYLTEALVQYRRHPGMETGRFEGVAELEHALQAKLVALDRARHLLPDAEELRMKVLDGSVREALGRAHRLLRDGLRGEAVPYLAFALASPAGTGGSVSASELVARIVAETAFVVERPPGSPATAREGIEDQGTEDASLTGSVDEPRPFAQVEGELIVRGWARVPGEDLGVAFDFDGVRREPSSIQRVPRPDVAVVFPGMGDISRSGFEARFPADGQAAGARTLTVTFRSRDRRYRRAAPILFRW
jgi:glycosyltransferase involved in cell wall biosynthesis